MSFQPKSQTAQLVRQSPLRELHCCRGVDPGGRQAASLLESPRMHHSRVFRHWSRSMDLKLSPAVDNSAPVIGSDVDRIIETSIPARLDALTWSGFHTRVVLALGITWILDGLEVTLAGALSGALKESPTFCSFPISTSALPTAPISRALCSARSASAGSPTGSGARNCSSSRSRSISPRPPRPRCPGGWRAMRCSGS